MVFKKLKVINRGVIKLNELRATLFQETTFWHSL